MRPTCPGSRRDREAAWPGLGGPGRDHVTARRTYYITQDDPITRRLQSTTLPPVNPVIWAAIISGGWAVVVAALGYRYNRVTAKATVQATNANALTALDAAHQAQLWEKKAETYVDTIAEITRRQAARFYLTRMLRFDEATEEKLRDSYAALECSRFFGHRIGLPVD